MVLVNRSNTLDLASLGPEDAHPGTPNSRMRAVSSAFVRMDEKEKEFHALNGPNSSRRGDNTPRTSTAGSSLRSGPISRSPRLPRTPMSCESRGTSRGGRSDITVMNHTVPLTERNSAISKSYSSPRQQMLSALGSRPILSRESSAMRPIGEACMSRVSFDYDEFEEIRLEQLKYYKPPRIPVYKTEDIYMKACSMCGITPSKSYLKQTTSDRTVMMSNTQLGHLSVKPIAISLVRDHRIHTLDLSGNDIGPLGAIYVSEMLIENDTICDLNLSGTNLGETGLQALAMAMTFNKSVQVLRLESNYLDHRETHLIVNIMRASPQLLELYLGHNNLGYAGAKLLAQELEENTTLRSLDVQWNHFRKESAKVICEALKENDGLHRVNLSWNGIGKEGCIALARALPKNDTLKDLDLTNNRIDVVALPFLLHGLVRNKTLKSLKIAKNPMTTEGAKAVVRAITGAKVPIKYLNIEDIPVDKEFTSLVKKMRDARDIHIDHGVEMYGAVELNIKAHDPHDLNRFDPTMVIVEYMRIDNLRLIDLFQFFDTSNRGLVSRTDLRNGVATLGLPLTEHHLDCIMKDIDKKRDGYIDLEEFMIAQRDMAKVIIQRTTRAKGKGKEDLGLKELRKILRELVDKRNQRNKEKAKKMMNSAVTKTKAVSLVSANVVKPVEATQPTAPVEPIPIVSIGLSGINREETFGLESVKEQDLNEAMIEPDDFEDDDGAITERITVLPDIAIDNSLVTHRLPPDDNVNDNRDDESFLPMIVPPQIAVEGIGLSDDALEEEKENGFIKEAWLTARNANLTV